MGPKIFRLPENVINKIAAGEVVEGPSSIVKELIENSLDAGATSITIDIVQGGQQLITVTDNGCGMGAIDAQNCLERHATSKLREVEDLDSLATMGFRGEALAAIASVSHLELQTSDGKEATRILSEAGKIKEILPCARNRGTTIDVRFLFYNVPARKKFQKSTTATTSQVKRSVETISLAHPNVSFRLTIGGKKSFEVAPSSQKKRIEEVLGEYAHAVKGDGVEGFIGAPTLASSTRNGQYLFINKRPIFSPLIAKAVKEGFGTRIAENAYPPFVLFLDVPSDAVDVNVHPQKKEVRFESESSLFKLVQRSVENAFGQMAPVEISSFTPVTSFADTWEPLPFKVSDETPLEFNLGFTEKGLAIVGHYLLLQKGALVLVDLQAAHARVLFEQVRFEKGAAQALMWPLEVKVDDEGEEIAEALNGLGIECRLLKKMLVVDALPEQLESAHFPLFFEQWKETRKIELAINHVCRSVKKNWQMEEAIRLFRRSQKCKDTTYDPLGNPIWTEVNPEDLNSLLRRK